jgi:hypothetical protein
MDDKRALLRRMDVERKATLWRQRACSHAGWEWVLSIQGMQDIEALRRHSLPSSRAGRRPVRAESTSPSLSSILASLGVSTGPLTTTDLTVKAVMGHDTNWPWPEATTHSTDILGRTAVTKSKGAADLGLDHTAQTNTTSFNPHSYRLLSLPNSVQPTRRRTLSRSAPKFPNHLPVGAGLEGSGGHWGPCKLPHPRP